MSGGVLIWFKFFLNSYWTAPRYPALSPVVEKVVGEIWRGQYDVVKLCDVFILNCVSISILLRIKQQFVLFGNFYFRYVKFWFLSLMSVVYRWRASFVGKLLFSTTNQSVSEDGLHNGFSLAFCRKSIGVWNIFIENTDL